MKTRMPYRSILGPPLGVAQHRRTLGHGAWSDRDLRSQLGGVAGAQQPRRCHLDSSPRSPRRQRPARPSSLLADRTSGAGDCNLCDPERRERYRVAGGSTASTRADRFADSPANTEPCFLQRVRQAQESVRGRSEAPIRRNTGGVRREVWAPRSRRRLAPRTWERDAAVYNKHLLHRLGGRPIAEIDTEACALAGGARKGRGGGPDDDQGDQHCLQRLWRGGPAASSDRRHHTPVALLEKPSAKRAAARWFGVRSSSTRPLPTADQFASHQPGERADGAARRVPRQLMEMTGYHPGEALALRRATWSSGSRSPRP